MSFHEIRFPTTISLGSSGGPERRTEIVVLGSGREERNSRWADSKRRFNAGYGVKTIDDLHDVIAFFEERRGRLYGFRWKDRTDYKSGKPLDTPTSTDQTIGSGDGVTATWQLKKTYGASHAPWSREITKPVSGTVIVAVDSIIQIEGINYSIDLTTGIMTFLTGHIPASGSTITAGFEFDVPVRFDTDHLEVDLTQFKAGQIANISLVEIRL